MSYFPTDIPFMSEEELKANGIKVNCSEKPNGSKLISGVLIEGMQMPYECRMCPLCRYFSSVGVTQCMVTQATLAEDYKTIQFEGRHEKCPLVEVKGDGE